MFKCAGAPAIFTIIPANLQRKKGISGNLPAGSASGLWINCRTEPEAQGTGSLPHRFNAVALALATPVYHPRAGAWGSVQWLRTPVKQQLYRSNTCPLT